MNLMVWLAFSVMMVLAQSVFAQTQRPAPHSVTAIRSWSLAEVTRVAIEVSGDFQYRTDRLHNPERIYFDILNARPWIDREHLLVVGGATLPDIGLVEGVDALVVGVVEILLVEVEPNERPLDLRRRRAALRRLLA